MNLLKKIIYSKPSISIIRPLDFTIYKYFVVPFVYPKIKNKLSKFNIKGRLSTVKELVKTNKSMSRFGDGEIQWMLGNKTGSFEKNSPLLRKRLKDVISANNKNFMVALPDALISINQFTNVAKKLWGRFVVKYGKQTLPYLTTNRIYYDTSVVRPYMDYKNKKLATTVFNDLKQIWNNKNILIVEGDKTRLGVGNDLFNNVNEVKRIECPVNDAFESYNKIYSTIINFLNNHKTKKFITLISLGPTATVLSYDIYQYGFRAIDIGHIDLEYSWYKLGLRKPQNIPYKYVNETSSHKDPSISINDNKYYEEILTKIN